MKQKEKQLFEDKFKATDRTVAVNFTQKVMEVLFIQQRQLLVDYKDIMLILY